MIKKIGKSAIVQELIGYFFYLYTIFVFKTTSWTVDDRLKSMLDKQESFLIPFWHGRLLGATFVYFLFKPISLKPYVLLSLHRDGRAVACAMAHYGINTVDGSTRRGGMAAGLTIMRLLKDKTLMAMAPDGRKPGYKMTVGLVKLAKESGCPIVFTAFSVKRGKIFKTWDKFLLPYPFNKGVIIHSEPIVVPPDLDDEGIEQWRVKLENMLIDLTQEADQLAGLKKAPNLRGQNA